MPFITYPLALIAAVGIPMLIGIYFFRNRFRRLQVSSLMLWKQINPPSEGGLRFNRLVLPAIFFLELIIICLLIISAMDPRWPGFTQHTPFVIILDDSASMSAVGSDGLSAKERALKVLKDQTAQYARGRLQVILSGSDSSVLMTSERGINDINRISSGWKCESPSDSIESSIALARDLGGKKSHVVIITDRAPPNDFKDIGIKWISTGTPLNNAGIISAGMSGGSKKLQCFAEIGSFSGIDSPATLTAKTENFEKQFALNLKSFSKEKVIFDLPPNTKQVKLSLSDDPFKADNEVSLVNPNKRPLLVKFAMKDTGMLQVIREALDSSGLEWGEAETADILITDSKPAEELPDRTWIFRIFEGELKGAYIGPYIMDKEHPLLRGASLEGAIWGATTETNMPGVPIVMAGNIPLFTVKESISGKIEMYLSFVKNASNVQQMPAWPIIFFNLLDWRSSNLEGPVEPNMPIGSSMKISADRSIKTIDAVFPSGSKLKLLPRHGQAVLPVFERGIYKINLGGTEYSAAGNLFSPSESDIKSCSSGEWGEYLSATEKKTYRSFAWIFLLAALAGLFWHLYLMKQQLKQSAKRSDR